jgi:hypothetical protein
LNPHLLSPSGLGLADKNFQQPQLMELMECGHNFAAGHSVVLPSNVEWLLLWLQTTRANKKQVCALPKKECERFFQAARQGARCEK